MRPLCSFFFFSSRRRHTRLTCDWSSDVCSSDLKQLDAVEGRQLAARRLRQDAAREAELHGLANPSFGLAHGAHLAEIGRASCRERVEISGVAVSLEKKRWHEQSTRLARGA